MNKVAAALFATILISTAVAATPPPVRAVDEGKIDSAWIHYVNRDDFVHLDGVIEGEGHGQMYLSYPSRTFELLLDLSELGDNDNLADSFSLTLSNGAFHGTYVSTVTDGIANDDACETSWVTSGGGSTLTGSVACGGAGTNYFTQVPFAISLPTTGPVVLAVNTTGEDFSVYFFVAEAGDTMYVGQGAIADGSGSCEAPDFSTDSEAQGSINAALFASFTAVDDDSDVIVICDGEYSYEDNFGLFDGDPFYDSITLRAETTGGVTLYGGLEELSFEDLFSGIVEEPLVEDFYQLLRVEAADLSVTGIRFAGGSGLGGIGEMPTELGGAITVLDGNLALERVSFDHNVAFVGGAVAVLGGSLTANRVAARENLAAGGGAVALFQMEDVSSVISNSTFTKNYGVEAGGAVLHGAGRLKMTSVGFTENRTAGSGGAVSTYGELEITGGYFQGNHCDVDWFEELVGGGEGGFPSLCDGGAIGSAVDFFGGGGLDSFVTVRGARFSQNVASGSGGGIFVGGLSNIAISGSNMTQNIAGDQGGAIRLDNANQYTVINGNTFTGNQAEQGGAVSLNDGVGEYPLAYQWQVNGNLFTSNSATLNGGALHMALDNSGSVVPTNVGRNRFNRNVAPAAGAVVVESNLGSERVIIRRFTRALRTNRYLSNRATRDRSTANLGVHFDK